VAAGVTAGVQALPPSKMARAATAMPAAVRVVTNTPQR